MAYFRKLQRCSFISSEEILKNTPKLDSSFAVYNI